MDVMVIAEVARVMCDFVVFIAMMT